MSANKFIDVPPSIIVWNPLENTSQGAFVILGDVPAAVYNACNSNSSQLLKDYYGANYKEKLLIGVDLSKIMPKYVGGESYENTVSNENTASENTASENTTPLTKHGLGDVDLDEIEELLSESVSTSKKAASVVKVQGAINVNIPPGVTYVRDVAIYPEDKYDELKGKIYLATGIPPYRQHIFYLDNGRPQVTYKLYTDGINMIDIRTLTAITTSIHGLPIDKSVYDQREVAKVEALDTFQTLETTLPLDNRIFVVDLGTFTNPRRTQLLELLRDTYQFELLYYGLILKYWPQLTIDCFRDYISDESDLQHRYPDLSPSIVTLRSLHKHERAIVDANYRNMPKLLSLAESDAFGLSITQMIAQVNGTGVMLNIRNIFEYFHTSAMIPEIHAWIENDNKRYLLVKKHVQSDDIAFPSGAMLRAGITFAISLRELGGDAMRYMFLNIWPSGKYHVKSVWNEEDEFSFDETTSVMKKYVDPIIADINKLGYYAFISMGKLTPISKSVLTYQSLTVCLFWKRVMTESTYKIIKTLWEPYFRAQIVKVRNVQQFDKYEFSLQKGMYQFDNTAIERIISASNNLTVNNYYAYLSNQQIKQKWDQNYGGRVVRMSHRTTDIRFEIADIREQEFQTAQVYLLGFIHAAASSPEVRAAMTAKRDYTDVKKLRKLREQDPELYNLKKYGSKKVYSIVCQNQRQPIIYTEDELRAMSSADKAKLTEYWNFTLNRPAWYGCPSRAYPHLSFMVGVHPKHYCLPCCNKKMREDDESRKVRINVSCVKNHQWTEESDGAISRHIMNYGKDIEVGRLSKLPQTSLKNLLHDTIGKADDNSKDQSKKDRSSNSDSDKDQSSHSNDSNNDNPHLSYYLYGVPQHVPGVENIGIIYSISAALSLSLPDYITGITKALNVISIDTLLRGVLTEYFRDTKELIAVINELFVDWKVIASVRLPYWPELFIELTQIVYNVSVVTFIDSAGTGVGINLHVVESVKNALLTGLTSCIAVIKRENNYYPMFVIDPDSYFKRMEVNTKIFSQKHQLTLLIKSMIKPVHTNVSRFNLHVVKEFCGQFGYVVSVKFVNQHNLCYGVAIVKNNTKDDTTDDGNTTAAVGAVYIPIEYSTNIPDNIPQVDTPDDNTEYRLDNTIEVYEKISKWISKLDLKPIQLTSLLYYHDALIGARTRIGTVYVNSAGGTISNVSGNVSSIVSSTIPIEHCSYDFREVNRVISQRIPPTIDGRSKIGDALYNNYRYQLFIIEFVNYLDKERNNEIRNKIYTLIADTNFKRDLAKFRKSLRELVGPSDYSTLQSIVSEFYIRGLSKAVLKDNIASRTYEFDRITLSYLQSLDNEKTESELFKIASTFAVDGEPTDLKDFPNIYLPCEESHAGYCSGEKLILRDMKKFVSVLASDIKDELRVSYLLNNVWMDAVVDLFKFTKISTEIISIYRLNE